MENLMLLVCQNEIVHFFLKIGQYDRPVQKQNITTALPALFLF